MVQTTSTAIPDFQTQELLLEQKGYKNLADLKIIPTEMLEN